MPSPVLASPQGARLKGKSPVSAPLENQEPAQASSVALRIKPLPGGVRRVFLETSRDGKRWFVLELIDGGTQRLRPEAFAEFLYSGYAGKNWLFVFLNITSPVGFLWVSLGLLGQVLFTGRMVLQWLVSERRKRSVVPIGFWWMSLGGASMLLAYFVWRRDIVGVLGQSTGWFIYVRNLWLIYRERMGTETPTEGV
jgi:lipid-A-disaccharide synthase-like uncharacterized protein